MWKNYEEFEKSGAPYVWGSEDSRSSVLHTAVYLWGLKDFLKLLPQCLDFINYQDAGGDTPLHKATNAKVSFQQEKVWYLCKNGADPTRRNMFCKTPLDCVSEHGYRTVSVFNLLEAGCRIRDVNPRSKTWLKKDNSNLAYCKLASMALGRALSKQGRIHKDTIPTIQRMVWETRRQKEWEIFYRQTLIGTVCAHVVIDGIMQIPPWCICQKK